MKRDMDLIRKLLLRLEETSGTGACDSDLIEGYSREQIGYHAYLIVDAGLATGTDVSSLGGPVPEYLLNYLTWNGHEFLDAARNETNWKKAKDCFAGVGGFSLLILKEILVALMKQQMGL